MSNLDEVKSASLEYFNGDELAANVFATKYALTNEEGDILELTPDDMHRRLSREFARIESKYSNAMSEDEIYGLLKDFKYVVPQGSPMSGIGNSYQVQSISNCFVIPSPHDSYGGILKTDQEMVQIAKRRGGIGFDISTIRPRGLTTANAAKTTDGIEVFMDRYSNSCREVAQNGRRGALMLTISVNHPQIEDFIRIKKNLDRVTGANISIRITNEFMEAATNDREYTLRWPVESSPDEAKVTKVVNAKKVWDQIIESAWESAEPGLLFWDNVQDYSPADIYKHLGFETVSTNPCGELPLCPLDSCRLLLVNLFSFVDNPFAENASFDYKKYGEVVQKAQRLMDDMIDLELEKIDLILNKIENDPEPDEVKFIERRLWESIREKAELGRRTGLGVTAVGDSIAALGMRYGSDESIEEIEKIYKHLALNAYRSSCNLAIERGAFPIHDHRLEEGHPFLSRIWSADPELLEMSRTHGRRNIALLTTAPAGSVSTLTQTTSGIEPAFLLKYTRRKKINAMENVEASFVDASGDRWIEFDVFHHKYKEYLDVTGKTHDDLESSPYWKATSNDIDWVQKVKLQAAAQKWVCHAISNTTNVPNDTSVDTIREIYEEGWRSGCKGVTVYRDGCRTGVLVSSDTGTEEESEFEQHNAPRRPESLPCEIHQVTIKGEAWTILVGVMEDKPYEIMGGLSKYVEIPKKYKEGVLLKRVRKTRASIYDLEFGDEGDEFKIKDVVSAFDNPNHSSFTRILSLSLRHGAPLHYIVEQLQKGDRDMDLFSFSKVIARVLKKFIVDGTKAGSSVCPDCEAEDSLYYTEGCMSCTSCGFSKCS
jgi:ribonucleoside-diphosphate reductase alpha chain